MKNLSKYRQLAGEWHDGQWSALYSFSSTGTITEFLPKEIRDCFPLANSRELKKLQSFHNAILKELAKLETNQEN